MDKTGTSCFKVSDTSLCPFCKSKEIIKNGRTKNKKQQYFCKKCSSRFIDYYTYQACNPDVNQQIITLTKEGLGIRSTARILQISATTLLKRIISIAHNIPQPVIGKNKTYEVDEICTFLKRKSRKIWIVYALERTNKTVAGFYVGTRTNKSLNVVLKTLHLAEAKNIFTDGLKNYKSLIARSIHQVKQYGTNRIERNNLTMRIHLKRLNRRTICFSRSFLVLTAVLRIYFWS
jgi:insertion element IS1 protein InsB